MTIQSLSAAKGNDTSNFFSFLLSDVQTFVDQTVNGQTIRVPTVFNDNARATIRIDAKNQSALTNPLNSVMLTRYHVTFRRTATIER